MIKEKFQSIQAASVGFALLAAGIFLGFWFATTEFRPGKGPEDEGAHLEATPAQLAEFNQKLEALQPRLQEFQKRFDAINTTFHTQFLAVLTESQRKHLSDHHHPSLDWVGDFNRDARDRIGETPSVLNVLPGPPEPPRRAFLTLLRILMYQPTLKIVTDRYQLTPDQEVKVQQLMEARRQAFLTLLQEDPLPLDSIYFSMRNLGLIAPPPSHP